MCDENDREGCRENNRLGVTELRGLGPGKVTDRVMVTGKGGKWRKGVM